MLHWKLYLYLVTAALIAAACAPAAAPSPTSAPAKPAEAPKPAQPAAEKAAPPTTAPAAKAEPKAAAPASKVDPKVIEDFYKGKNIRIIVGFAAGGGYDTYARLMARHFGKHIPGNPGVVVENQPGAGSLLAANTVYSQAPKDGTVIVHFIGGMITQKIIVENPAATFEPDKYNWIGAPTPDTATCALRKESGFTSFDQARTREMILGGTAPGSTTNDVVNVLRVGLGFNMKLVDGYDGTAKIRLAADGGEIMGGCWGWESVSVTWKDALEKNEVLILAQGGAKPHPDLQGVPMFSSFARNDEERKLIDAGITSPGQISRVMALPPDVPAERVTAIREAFMATLADPALLEESQKSGIAIDPISPEEVSQRIEALRTLPPDLKQKLKEAVGT